MLKSTIKRFLNHFGYDIQHLPTDRFSREQMWLFQKHGIDLLFDIGANEGQYAKRIRRLGYKGKIVSFEPLPDAYMKLAAAAANDRNWTVVNTALGNSIGEVTLNISKNSYSSSILNILPTHLQSAPDAKYIGTTKIPIRMLDSIIDEFYQPGKNLFLKIDTQGYEKKVLEGALNSIDKVLGIQLELSISPQYEGETPMIEIIEFLSVYGFKLLQMDQGHASYRTGEVLQLEGIFFR